MLTIAPVAAVTTLVCWSPERWGGSLNPLHILVMAFFGLFTVFLWPTYIPAIVLTPHLMRRIAAREAFTRAPLPLLIATSMLIGAGAGICIFAFVIFMSLADSSELALSWMTAGAVSGALTLSVICLIYRYAPQGG